MSAAVRTAIRRPEGRLWSLAVLLVVGALLTGGGWLLARQAEREAAGLAAAGSRDDRRGMTVWLYDNPFQTGSARESVRRPPRLHLPRTEERDRVHPFAWRWLGRLEAPADGVYLLGVYSSEAMRLLVDGRPVIERWVAHPGRDLEALVELTAGPHLLDLQNVQTAHGLDLTLYWAPPGAAQPMPLPAEAVRPVSGLTRTGLSELYRAGARWRTLTWLLPLAWLLIWGLGLWRPARLAALWREHHWFLLILLLAGLLRLLWADRVPGLSGEEAFFSWRAELILEGALPWEGMTTRTGPFLDYLLAPFTAVFGPSPWVIRGLGGVITSLALVFAYRAVDREAGRPAALASCLLLAVLPALVIFNRMPGDNTTLGPLIFFWGLDLVSRSRRRPGLAIWGGALWGLGVVNHSIFAVLPVALGLAALVVSLGRILLRPQTWGWALGLALGVLPRVLDRMLNPVQDVMSFTDPDRVSKLLGFLEMFGRTLEGEVAYLVFVGREYWEVPWILPAALTLGLLALAWGLWRRRDRSWWLGPWLALALVIHLAMVPLGAPSANPRYYLYCLYFAALILGLALGRTYEWSPPRLRPLAAGLAPALAAWCVFSLGINLFYSHLSSGGQTRAWKTDLLDHTPDAWMDHSRLAAELARRGFPVVAAGDFWHHTLHLALNLDQGEPRTFEAVGMRSRSGTERAAVFYNSYEGRERAHRFLIGHAESVFLPASLGPELDRKYIFYERTWPPVDYPELPAEPERGGRP